MYSPDITNTQLKTLAEQDKVLNSTYFNDRLNKLGLQENLGELYKPILESTKNIETKIEESSKNIAEKIEKSKPIVLTDTTKMEDKLDEIVALLDNFPNVIAHLRGDVAQPLTQEDVEVIQTLDKLPDSDLKEIVKEVTSSEKEYTPIFNAFKYEDKDTINRIKNNPQSVEELINYAVNSNVEYPRMSSLYRAVNNHIPTFLHEVETRRALAGKVKKGTGIRFLPSSTKDLVSEMNRLLGSYKAGNKNTFNEISAISDILRDRKLMTPEMSKKIFKFMKLH